MPMRFAPVSEPITGREPWFDLTQPRAALAQFYRALNTRDLGLLQENWEDSREAAMDNPLGGICRGWTEIRAVYERLFRSTAAFRFEFWDYTLHQTADVFWVVGRERGTFAPPGTPPLDLSIRTTRLFRCDPLGRWRQAHHHGSIDQPSLLAAYQRAVLERADVGRATGTDARVGASPSPC